MIMFLFYIVIKNIMRLRGINNAALKWVDMADSEPFVAWGFKRLYCVPDYTNDK